MITKILLALCIIPSLIFAQKVKVMSSNTYDIVEFYKLNPDRKSYNLTGTETKTVFECLLLEDHSIIIRDTSKKDFSEYKIVDMWTKGSAYLYATDTVDVEKDFILEMYYDDVYFLMDVIGRNNLTRYKRKKE